MFGLMIRIGMMNRIKIGVIISTDGIIIKNEDDV